MCVNDLIWNLSFESVAIVIHNYSTIQIKQHSIPVHLRDQKHTKGVLWYVIRCNNCHSTTYMYNMQNIIIRKFCIYFYYNLPDYLTHTNQHHFIDIETSMQLFVRSMNKKDNMGKKRPHREIMIDHQHNNTQVTTTYGMRCTVLFNFINKIILILFAIMNLPASNICDPGGWSQWLFDDCHFKSLMQDTANSLRQLCTEIGDDFFLRVVSKQYWQ